MQKRNFGQVRRQKELSRKQRQQEKLDRRHARIVNPSQADIQPDATTSTGEAPKTGDVA
jgi:hypothetical protein